MNTTRHELIRNTERMIFELVEGSDEVKVTHRFGSEPTLANLAGTGRIYVKTRKAARAKWVECVRAGFRVA